VVFFKGNKVSVVFNVIVSWFSTASPTKLSISNEKKGNREGSLESNVGSSTATSIIYCIIIPRLRCPLNLKSSRRSKTALGRLTFRPLKLLKKNPTTDPELRLNRSKYFSIKAEE
jgi:hypothetical protein